MARRFMPFARAGVATRLLFWFMAIALVPCALLAAVTSYLARRSLEHSVHERLTLIAEGKASQLENFARERRGDAQIVGEAPGINQAIDDLGEAIKTVAPDSADYRRRADGQRAQLSRFVRIYGYQNLMLFDTRGAMLVAHEPFLEPGENVATGSFRGTELADVFERARATKQPALSHYQIYPTRKEPAAFMAGPVLKDGALRGVVIFEFGNAEVFRVFSDYSGLGETGETLAAMRAGDELIFISPSRFDPDLAFRRRVRIGSGEAIATQNAVLEKKGYGRVTDLRNHDVLAAWSFLPSFRWGLVVKQDADEAFAMITHLRLAVIALFVGSGVFVLVVSKLVARSLTRPVREAAGVAEAIAAGDLTRKITRKAPGEVGQLLDAVRVMTQDLRTLIGKIQKSSVALMSTATEIAATARQQEQTVVEYGASTNEAAAAVCEISATGQKLLGTMNEVNEAAGRTAAMARTGRDDLAGMDRTMRTLADATGSIGARLSVISERAANINLAVTTITKVADQTNLLSINAAIEAEKAGESGLGFLVVAREIRRLADQTAVATLDIERMVKEMQSSVAAGVMEMDQFRDKVRQGVEDVAHIGAQLGQIIAEVQGLTDRFEQVTEGMRVQAQGAEQIREAVVHINEGANQTSVALREFNKATAYLREAVGVLKEEVSRFTLGEPATESPTQLSG